MTLISALIAAIVIVSIFVAFLSLVLRGLLDRLDASF